jgi:hypothetical protein
LVLNVMWSTVKKVASGDTIWYSVKKAIWLVQSFISDHNRGVITDLWPLRVWLNAVHQTPDYPLPRHTNRTNLAATLLPIRESCLFYSNFVMIAMTQFVLWPYIMHAVKYYRIESRYQSKYSCQFSQYLLEQSTKLGTQYTAPFRTNRQSQKGW